MLSWRIDVYERISIHAPREGCDKPDGYPFLVDNQSTHPVRGATSRSRRILASEHRFQSTHPVRGATRSAGCRRCR